MNYPTGAVTVLGTGTIVEPVNQPPLDFLIACVWMFAAEVLAHQLEAKVEEVHR